MLLAPSLRRIKPSATFALASRAKALAQDGSGLPVLNLGVGEPDFPPPQEVQDAAIQAIRDGRCTYTEIPGLLALREGIARKLYQDQQLSYSPQDIIVGAGAKQVIFNALVATLSPGDEVIIPTPVWTSYPDIVLLTGADPVFVPCAQDNQFKLTADDLRRVLTPRTKWLILNAPGNPAGGVYSEDELKALGQVLLDFPKVWVLSDDIYEIFVYDKRPFLSLLQVTPGLADRFLVVNGFSKSHCMTGWRLGYGAGPRELIQGMTTLQSQSTTCPSIISQIAGMAALSLPDTWKLSLRDRFETRRNHAIEALKRTPELEAESPEGAFYIYLNCRHLLGRKTPSGQILQTDTEVADYFLTQARVSLIPGTAFHCSPYVRLAYAISEEALTQATHQLASAIALLKIPG